MSTSQLTEVCALFNNADTDGNGVLDIGEVKEVIGKGCEEEIFAKYFADEDERLDQAVNHVFDTVFMDEEMSREVFEEVLLN